MNIKVYNRRGRRNYKEVRLVSELEKELEKRLADDPRLAFSFRPAETFKELEAMHAQYVARDAEFEDIKFPKNEENMAKRNAENSEEELLDNDSILDEIEDDSSFIDPFNRQEPTTYDYTNEGGFAKDSTPQNTGQTDFAEPLSFDEAFEIPEDGEDEDPVENQKAQKKPDKEKAQKKQPKKEDPWNPAFDEMSNGNKTKSTKKFAKYIVEAICAVSEKAFVWYANKDINDAKLAEYELANEMNLQILVTLDNGQEATVKQFFRQQCLTAQQLAKIKDEKKKDMAESLAAVLLEKGFAPTASQEALMVFGGVFIEQGAILLSLSAQNNSLLNQLRVMHQGQQTYEPTPQYQQPQPQYEAPANQPYSDVNGVPNMSFEESGLVSDADMLDIERVVDTKE
jgi:hypothetical protein